MKSELEPIQPNKNQEYVKTRLILRSIDNPAKKQAHPYHSDDEYKEILKADKSDEYNKTLDRFKQLIKPMLTKEIQKKIEILKYLKAVCQKSLLSQKRVRPIDEKYPTSSMEETFYTVILLEDVIHLACQKLIMLRKPPMSDFAISNSGKLIRIEFSRKPVKMHWFNWEN